VTCSSFKNNTPPHFSWRLTEHDGHRGKESAAQCVHQPEGGALELRSVEGQQGVAGPHQQGEEDQGSRQPQAQSELLAAAAATVCGTQRACFTAEENDVIIIMSHNNNISGLQCFLVAFTRKGQRYRDPMWDSI